MKNTLFVLLTFCWLCSCKPQPKIPGFRAHLWEADKMGCSGARTEQAKTLLANKKMLQGLSERDLYLILGKPDQQVLYERNTKDLIYYTSSGGQCGKGKKPGPRIVVELNALGHVTWIHEEHI